MSMRTRGRRTFRRSARRRTRWDRVQLQGTALAAASGSIVAATLLLPTVANQGTTVLRIVGQVIILPASVPATAGAYNGNMGIYVDTAEAVAAGATLEPGSDDGPWMFLTEWAFHQSTAVGSSSIWSAELDVKAQRKLSSQSELMAIFESRGNTDSVTIDLQGRILRALP